MINDDLVLPLVGRGDFIEDAPTTWDEDYRNTWADYQAAQRNKMIYRAAWLSVREELAATKAALSMEKKK